MPRRLTTRLDFLGCTGLAVVLGLAAGCARNLPALPAEAAYADRPAAFQRVLAETREKLRRPGDDPAALRKLARLYQANRLYPEARACYRLLAALPPGLSARDHYYLADIAQNENDLAGAQIELRAVLETEPGYVAARLALAEALFKSGHEDEAGREYAAILPVEANHPQALLGLARVELQQGHDDAAVARLETLMSSHPESASGAALFAQVLDRRGDTERAAALTQLSRQQHEPVPPDPWRSDLLADCYDAQHLALTFEEYLTAGQLAEALPLLDRVEELDPKSSIPQLLRGWSQARTRHYPEAAQEYRRALAKGGDPEKIGPLLVDALVALKQLPEAAAVMAEYHAKLPDSIPILLAYADVAVKTGDEPLARTLLSKILQKEPYLYTPNMNLAKILWSAGERDAAAVCLQRVVKVFAVDVASRGLLGQYYLEKADPVSAIPPLEQARATVPEKSPARARLTLMLNTAYLQAGEAQAEQAHFASAADTFAKAARLVPADPRAYAGLANAQVQLRQFAPAAAALTALAALQPDNPTIQLSLGDVLAQTGDTAGAGQHWQAALQLAPPGDTELRGALRSRLDGRAGAEMAK